MYFFALRTPLMKSPKNSGPDESTVYGSVVFDEDAPSGDLTSDRHEAIDKARGIAIPKSGGDDTEAEWKPQFFMN